MSKGPYIWGIFRIGNTPVMADIQGAIFEYGKVRREIPLEELAKRLEAANDTTAKGNVSRTDAPVDGASADTGGDAHEVQDGQGGSILRRPEQ